MGTFKVKDKGAYDINSMDSFCDGKIDCYYNEADIFYGFIIMDCKVSLDDKILLPCGAEEFSTLFDDAKLDYKVKV